MIFQKYEDKYEDDLTCPYCNYKFPDSWESCSEEERLINCPKCRKYFYGWMEQSVEYKSKPDCKLNKEEHQFEDNNDGWLNCKICGKFKEKQNGKI